jgi:hypothetical protein
VRVAATRRLGRARAPPYGEDGGGHQAICQADVAKYCAKLQPGSQELRMCIRQNRDSFSDTCQVSRKLRGGRGGRGGGGGGFGGGFGGGGGGP